MSKKPTPTKSIPEAWKAFALIAIEINKNIEPEGLIWFYKLHSLLKKNAKKTRKYLPKEHPLKTISGIPKNIREKLDTDLKEKKETLERAINDLKSLLDDVKKVKEIDFSGLPFDEETDFSNFIFPIDTSFEHAQFSQDINFINAIFLKDAVFNDAKFFANAYFNDAVFCETADFEDAQFQTKDSYCKETAKFRNTVFEKIANFRNATFWGYANFKGAKLEGRAFFQKAKFKWHAPRFYDATFNNEMTWAGITLPEFAEAKVDRHTKVGEKFEPVKCDECTRCAECARCAKCVEHNRFDKCDICDICFKYSKCGKCGKCKELIKENHRRRIEENQNSYENTAILLEGTKKFHDQHFFFRKEMQCRRYLEKNKLICLSFWLYEILADYGYGIECAIKAWLWHIFIGAVAISIIASSGNLETWQHLSCSVSVSIANANPFIFVLIKDGSLKDCYECLQDILPLGFGAIRGFQAFIGVTLLFLLLTTLRIRFRLNTKT